MSRVQIIEASDVSFAYRAGRPVLRSISVGFGACVTSVLGPNGAGKSTLLRVLGGLLDPGEGAVMLAGTDVRTMSARARASCMAYVAQRPLFSAPFTVREVVALGVPDAPASSEAVTGAMRSCQLVGADTQIVTTLSVGQQQRVALARAVAQLWIPGDKGEAPRGVSTPRVLLADEPFSALDPAFQRSTAGVLRGLAASGVAVIAVMHDAALAARLADRTLLLDAEGSIAGEGTAEEVLTASRLAELYGTRFVEASVTDRGTPYGSPVTRFPMPDLGPAGVEPIASERAGRDAAGPTEDG